jgi:dipeptidase
MIDKHVTDLVSAGKNEEAKLYVTDYTNDFAYAAMKRWEEMKATLWGMFARGF